MVRDNKDLVIKQELRDLDGILPESIDRRKFLGTAVTSMFTAGLAGCMGEDEGNGSESTTDDGDTDTGEDNNDTDEGGGDLIELDRSSVVYRNTWEAESDYSPGFVADLMGYWNDQNIRPAPTTQKGFGSGDTASRVGTDQEMLGQGGIDPVVGGLLEGYNLTITGGVKTRATNALLYEEGSMQDPLNELEGKSISVESAYEQQTLALLLQEAGVTEDDLDITTADEAAAYSMLAQGDIDAVWATAGNLPEAESAMSDVGITLDAELLYEHLPVYGYVQYANTDFLEENQEYVTRVLSGYSHALGWVILNPEETAEFMQEDVNQALQTQEIEQMVEVINVAIIATNLTEEAEESGLCALDQDKMQTTFDSLTDALDLGDSPPDAEETVAWEVQENANLRELSSDEWAQAEEQAGRYLEMFNN